MKPIAYLLASVDHGTEDTVIGVEARSKQAIPAVGQSFQVVELMHSQNENVAVRAAEASLHRGWMIDKEETRMKEIRGVFVKKTTLVQIPVGMVSPT